MATAPKVTDLYGDIPAKEAAARHEDYLAALAKSNSAPISAAQLMGAEQPASPVAALQSVLADESVTKSMSADALASLNSALDAQIAKGTGDLGLTASGAFGAGSGLVAFDLEAPAKLLTPRPTPLRNKLPRKKGTGLAHRIKRITGYTGTGTGVANIFPGITDSTTTTFGSIAFQRGPKIAYSAEDALFTYKQFSLSDAVPFSAQFQGAGYQDIRQLSQTSLLYAHMLMEERMLLMSRGTDSGLSGQLAAPTITLTARAAATGETALGLTDKVYVLVTSDAGEFGQSVLSGSGTATALGANLTSGQVVDVTITTPVSGALGYRVYAAHGSSDPGNAANWYQGRTATQTFTLQGTLATSGVAASTVTGDTSAYATGYDGILPQIFANANANNINRINSAFSTTNPGVEFQTVFYNLYNGYKADPDEILINGADRKQLSDAIKGGSSVGAYRLNITQDEVNGVVAGSIVTGLHNEVTGKAVNLTVHPWLPQGVAPVLSYTLPIPDSNVSDVWSVVSSGTDLMAVEWPVTQFAYEASTYAINTLVGYAPNWNGVVCGIKNV